jgi:hypothetical protein
MANPISALSSRSAIISFGIITAACICCLLFKPAPFVYVAGHFGYFFDEYYDGSPPFKKFAADLRKSFETSTKKDSVILLYYQPSLHSDCVIRLTQDSTYITKINCRLDITSCSKYDGIILNKDTKKYGAGELFRESMYLKVLSVVNGTMKSIRHKYGMPPVTDGADIDVVFHLGNTFNAFEFYVSKYHDMRYNALQQTVAAILQKSGTVPTEELKNFGFDW